MNIDGRPALFDIPTRSVLSPSSSVDSGLVSTNSESSFPIRKQRFDDRSQTRISLQKAYDAELLGHRNGTSSQVSSSFLGLSPRVDRNRFSHTKEALQWSETTHINHIINSGDFVQKHGAAVYIEASSLYLAIGTSKGKVVGFNYHQKIEFVLQGNDVAISSLAFASDSSFLAAGSLSGEVRIWDLSVSSVDIEGTIPYYSIPPITLQDRFTKDTQGHLESLPITHIEFLGNSNSKLISVDVSGLIFYHSGLKKFMKKIFITSKLLGNNDSNTNDPKFTIHGCEALPIGSSDQLTDRLSLLAIITNSALLVVSALSLNDNKNIHLVTHFKAGRPKLAQSENTASIFNSPSPMPENTPVLTLEGQPINLSGDSQDICLNWYPCMKNTDGKGPKLHNARLAYSWNDTVTILELNNEILPQNLTRVIDDLKDKDRGIPKLPISKTCRWVTSSKRERVVMIKWITSSLIFLFLKKEDNESLKLKVLYYSRITAETSETKPSGVIRVLGLGQELKVESTIISNPTHLKNKEPGAPIKSYESSIKCHKQRLIVMLRDESPKVYIGKLLNWADILMGMLSRGEYSKALLTVNEFYTTENQVGRLVLIGLPEDGTLRCKLLRPYLFEIMKESIHPIFREGSGDIDSDEDYLSIYLSLLSALYKENVDTEKLHEILTDLYEANPDENLFFDQLQPYILNGQISSLSPTVLNQLVKHYIQIDRGLLLTDILCIVDLTFLNIDLTINLCEKNQLRDCLIYVWTYILNDYQTPLVDFIRDFSSDSLVSEEDRLMLYTFLSFILTGRQYPTDNFMRFEKEAKAKHDICSILFSNTCIDWPKGSSQELEVGNDSTIFPYLYLFLKGDSFEMLSTLNEFFEDPSLNEGISLEEDISPISGSGSNSTASSLNQKQDGITRQYIIEALLDIYESNDTEFTQYDKCQLAIFIGRNYSKYSQFIRLSESVLNLVVDTLCENSDARISADCELALQSLLPYYEPYNDDFLLEKLKIAKFYDVLIDLYSSKGKYGQVLEVWLKKSDGLDKHSFGDILEKSLSLTRNPSDMLNVTRVIRKNFERLANIDFSILIELSNKYNPSLNFEVVKFENEPLAFRYLEHWFEVGAKIDTDKEVVLIRKYIELLCKFGNKGETQKFVNSWKEQIVKGKNQKGLQDSDDNSEVSDISEDTSSEYDKIVRVLRDNENIESLAILQVHQNHYDVALGEILLFMVGNFRSLEEDGSLLQRYQVLLDQAMSICELPGTYQDLEDRLTLNEKMWLDLIGVMINMTSNSKARVQEFMNKCVHRCFRAISDNKLNPGDRKEDSFLRIFHTILDSSHSLPAEYSIANGSEEKETSAEDIESSKKATTIATLANIRDILQEVFVSYSYESEMLEISLRMLNKHIHKNITVIRADHVKGWVPAKNCSACGKAMWGAAVSGSNQAAWERRQEDELFRAGSKFGRPTDNTGEKLVLFKCNHGYHWDCIGWGEMKCVICAE